MPLLLYLLPGISVAWYVCCLLLLPVGLSAEMSGFGEMLVENTGDFLCRDFAVARFIWHHDIWTRLAALHTACRLHGDFLIQSPIVQLLLQRGDNCPSSLFAAVRFTADKNTGFLLFCLREFWGDRRLIQRFCGSVDRNCSTSNRATDRRTDRRFSAEFPNGAVGTFVSDQRRDLVGSTLHSTLFKIPLLISQDFDVHSRQERSIQQGTKRFGKLDLLFTVFCREPQILELVAVTQSESQKLSFEPKINRSESRTMSHGREWGRGGESR